ncbi:OmpA family protein [Marivita lacus]|nr:OmpA family protein [Marivita lacus]
MSLAPLKTTTALFASLSLLLPHTALVTSAAAQEVELLCLDESEPPCPEGEPEQGSTPMERADFVAAQAARLAEEAQEAARLIEEDAAAAKEEAARLEQEAADAAEADQAQAQAEAERAALAAAEVEAQVEALRAEAEAAEAEAAQMAAEAEAQAADAAAAEAEAQAVDEAAAAEAEAQADEDAAVAEAEAQAAQDAASADEAAAVETEAQAAEQAEAAEAEAQAAEEAQVAEDVAKAEAETEAQVAEEAETADPEAIAAEEQTETEAETGAAEIDAADTTALVDPTVVEDDEVPAAPMAETASEPEAVVEETLDAQSVRSSEQDFATAIGSEESSASSGNESSGMSNLEKALLLGLGAVVVGSVLRNGDRVVENTGDRVVVESPDGFTVYKDDDALLRQPGAMMRTETFADGSTSTTLTREDGSQVVTIRDARGRVLRREAIYPDGTRYELFDDLQASAAVDVRQLQATRPVPRSLSVAENDLAALRAALRADMAFDPDRTFSLRQIREIEQVRSLVPAIDLDTVTFASGSAAIPAVQARSLVRLGSLIEELLLENPREVFLIEGHTDAAGSESYNLALSDRRAESVALALTEAFRIPPENLIVQGYGESFLKVQTEAAEERNRRATVRRITPLLREIAAN